VGLDLVLIFPLGGVVEAVDVGEVDPAPGGGSARLVLEDDRDVPVPLPGLGDEGVRLEDLAVAEVLLQPLEDGYVGAMTRKSWAREEPSSQREWK
jgi:hypothetical protein